MARAFAQLQNASFSSDGTIYMDYNVTYVDPAQTIVEARTIQVVVLSTDSAVGMQIKLSAAIKQGGADIGLTVSNDEITQPAYLKGITVYNPVRAASVSNVNVNAPGDTLDTVVLTPDVDRVLLKDQTNSRQNGIYMFHGGDQALTRTSDADDGQEVVSGAAVLVIEGQLNAISQWLISSVNPAPWVSGTSGTVWQRFVFPPLV